MLNNHWCIQNVILQFGINTECYFRFHPIVQNQTQCIFGVYRRTIYIKFSLQKNSTDDSLLIYICHHCLNIPNYFVKIGISRILWFSNHCVLSNTVILGLHWFKGIESLPQTWILQFIYLSSLKMQTFYT